MLQLILQFRPSRESLENNVSKGLNQGGVLMGPEIFFFFFSFIFQFRIEGRRP